MVDISLYIDYIIMSSFCTPMSSFSLPLQSLQFFNQAEFFKKTFYFEHLVSVPVFPPVKTRIYLAHRKDVPLSEAALQFIRYIRFKENQMPGKGV